MNTIDSIEINPESVRVVKYTTAETLMMLRSEIQVLSHTIGALVDSNVRLSILVDTKLTSSKKGKKKSRKKK